MSKMPNILIVDDDESFVLSLAEGLFCQNHGFKIFTTKNGKEAVKTLNSKKIDLVVTDIKMPEMDGFELVAYISKNYKAISIIVITAFGTPEIEKILMKSVRFNTWKNPWILMSWKKKLLRD